MSEANAVSRDEFRLLVLRAGLDLPEPELEKLRPMFEFYRQRTGVLSDLDLGAQDLAVAYSPGWDPVD